MVDSLEAVASHRRALVYGIGGGGDVVGAVSTARLLESLDVEVILGGVAWEPVPRDPRPGPRTIDELRGVEPVADRVARVSASARTIDDAPLAEAGVARHVENEVWVLDVTGGTGPLRAGLEEAVETAGIDLVVGIDAGGDALARGDEPGLRSPLADAVGVITLTDIDVPSLLGVIGFGSDGELTHPELTAGLGEIATDGGLVGAWGLTPDVVDELDAILADVATEASRIPVDAARGGFGTYAIRGGRREVTATPASTVTFYVAPERVRERSTLIEPVARSWTLAEAGERLAAAGITTEYDLERARLEEDG